MSSQPQSQDPSNITSTQQQSSRLKWGLELLQYLYICILCLLTVIFLLQFYWNLRKRRSKLSTQIKIHMFSWALSLTFTSIYYLPLIYFLLWPALEYSLFWLVVRGAMSLACVSTMPLSMTFLVLDRIFSISYPTLAQSKFRFYAQCTSVLILILNYTYVFNSMFWRAYTPTIETTTCMTLACLAYDKIYDLVVFKMLIGIANIILGCYFVYIFYRYRKKLNGRREKKKNHMLLQVLLTELFLNILPTSLYLIFYNSSIPIVSIILGTIMTSPYVTDGFTNMIIYRRNFHHSLDSKSHNLRSVLPITGDHHIGVASSIISNSHT